jgi:predicted KAP-like P-loop ATPase
MRNSTITIQDSIYELFYEETKDKRSSYSKYFKELIHLQGVNDWSIYLLHNITSILCTATVTGCDFVIGSRNILMNERY